MRFWYGLNWPTILASSPNEEYIDVVKSILRSIAMFYSKVRMDIFLQYMKVWVCAVCIVLDYDEHGHSWALLLAVAKTIVISHRRILLVVFLVCVCLCV